MAALGNPDRNVSKNALQNAGVEVHTNPECIAASMGIWPGSIAAIRFFGGNLWDFKGTRDEMGDWFIDLVLKALGKDPRLYFRLPLCLRSSKDIIDNYVIPHSHVFLKADDAIRSRENLLSHVCANKINLGLLPFDIRESLSGKQLVIEAVKKFPDLIGKIKIPLTRQDVAGELVNIYPEFLKHVDPELGGSRRYVESFLRKHGMRPLRYVSPRLQTLIRQDIKTMKIFMMIIKKLSKYHVFRIRPLSLIFLFCDCEYLQTI
jgi:hypothetical protein